MPSGDLFALGLREAADAVRAGSVSPVELTEACLARIRAHDGAIRAWAHLDQDGALATARERLAEVRAGRLRGPLHGVPVGVKDIVDVAGMPAPGGAKPVAHTRPAVDAPAGSRLRAAGAIILGKTVTTEFAYRDPAPTRNPWNRGHTPGGSSAGSAAALAARMAPLAIGSQTVGSVLRPAAYCGVVGFKGTHGLVPVAGVIPLAWSLDHVGVLTRSVADAALAMSVLAGRDLTPLLVSAAAGPGTRAPEPGLPRGRGAHRGGGRRLRSRRRHGIEDRAVALVSRSPGRGIDGARGGGRGLPRAVVRQACRRVQSRDAEPHRSRPRRVGDRLR